MKRNKEIPSYYAYSWSVPNPSNVLDGYLEGRPSDEEIRERTENAIKRRAEWKPSEEAMQFFEDVKKYCIGHRVEILLRSFSPFAFFDDEDDKRPHPFEAECKDVVILEDEEFPQAYLVVDNIFNTCWSESGESPRLTSRNYIAGQLVSLADIRELCVE